MRRFIFELIVCVSLLACYFVDVSQYANGYSGIPGNSQTFTAGSKSTHYKIEQLEFVNWRSRIGSYLAAGRLADALPKAGADTAFGVYHTVWLALLFLLVASALKESLTINLGIFAAAMYCLTPAAGMRAYPWDWPGTVFFTMSILCAMRKQYAWMLASILMGFLFKETVLLCALLLLWNSDWKLSNRIVGLINFIVICMFIKKLLMSGLYIAPNVMTMGKGAAFDWKHNWNDFTIQNWNTLIHFRPDHVTFVSAGSLLAVLLLGWFKKENWPYMIVIMLFLVGQLLYAFINEYRIFLELVPLAFILLLNKDKAKFGLREANCLSACCALIIAFTIPCVAYQYWLASVARAVK